MRVLLVEDDAKLVKYVGKALRQESFAVDTATDGLEGLRLAETEDYDVIVLDIMLPGLSGLDVLARLRAGGDKVHVLLLTARDTVDDRVHGLAEGADDYLVKPFAVEELIARVRALARRSHGVKNAVISVGDLTVDTARKAVRRGGREIELRPREYALLECLVLHRGEVVSKTELETHIYDSLVEPMSNVVEASISLLRKQLDVPGEPSLVRTRRGAGYIIEVPEP